MRCIDCEKWVLNPLTKAKCKQGMLKTKFLLGFCIKDKKTKATWAYDQCCK